MQHAQITYKNILNIPIMPVSKIKEKLLLEQPHCIDEPKMAYNLIKVELW